MSIDLAIRDRDPGELALAFVAPLETIKRQIQQLEEFKREIMVKGVDYGEIPGTDKPTLLKPGAEKLALAFGLAPVFEHAKVIEEWERGFFHYEETCRLVNKRNGQVVATASGSANTREPRYRWRKAERVCPYCNQPSIIKGQERFGGGWICWARKGGCGAKFDAADERITQQVVGNVENPEPWELCNTVLKMAQKRALVAAVLIATGGSGTWTQDLEDLVPEGGQVIDAQSRPVSEAPPAPPPPQRPPPRNIRQAVARDLVEAKGKQNCADCGKQTESESLEKSAIERFGRPLCVACFNRASDAAAAASGEDGGLPF